MILAGVALHELLAPGQADAFGSGFVGLELRHTLEDNNGKGGVRQPLFPKHHAPGN